MKERVHRLTAILLLLCMLASNTKIVKAENSEKISFEATDYTLTASSLFDIEDGEENEEGAEVELHSSDEVVRVAILLESDSTIEQGYSTLGIAENRAANEYRDQLAEEQKMVTEYIEEELGESLDVEWNLTLVTNIISANVEYGQIEEIEKIDGVEKVVVEMQYYPQVISEDDALDTNMVSSGEMMHTIQAWDNGYTGAGTRIAVIDTGLDVDHQSLSVSAYEYALKQNAESKSLSYEEYIEGLDLLDVQEISSKLSKLNAYTKGASDAAQLLVNQKIPFGFNYKDKDYDIVHDNDSAGSHGSHVSGIAAANRYIEVNGVMQDALSTVQCAGNAPDAQLLVMKVYGKNGGAYESDIYAALEDAIVLGADAVNMSLGTTSPGFADAGIYQEIMENLKNTDTVVSAAAGNFGEWITKSSSRESLLGGAYLYATEVNMNMLSSPGSATNTLTVASVNKISSSGSDYIMSSFSSWGTTGDLALKPEITAVGSQIYSINGGVTATNRYKTMSGTSMSAPQISGISALVGEYVETKGYTASFTNSRRGLVQSLLMSTAIPIKDADGNYYPIMQQGAGLVDADAATSAESYIKMSKTATISYDDGKVKAELGDDPERTGIYAFDYEICNLTNQAKTYTLTADVFAQDWLNGKSSDGSKYDTYYMAKSTISLDADVAFKVDGENVTSMTLPANGNKQVQVVITLSDAAKETYLEKYFKFGTYIQAYVFVNEEGGTSHSIPVLAFYGNWTDSSMYYGNSSYEGEYTEAYLTDATTDFSRETNCFGLMNGSEEVTVENCFYVTVDDTTYAFGGNALIPDSCYMPERNAIQKDAIIKEAVCYLGRNATYGEWNISNLTVGTTSLISQSEDEFAGAYSNSKKENTGLIRTSLGYEIKDVKEGDQLELSMTFLPEYYDAGKMGDGRQPGDGAKASVTAVVDDVAPVVADIVVDADGETLRVTASDNRYVAAIVLCDGVNEEVLCSIGSKNEIAVGASAVYELDLTGIDASKYYLSIFDYALNETVYQFSIGDLKYDFNGDDIVDADDVQCLLDYVVGKNKSITNKELSDIDGDGDTDTYDVYLFRKMLPSYPILVPQMADTENDVEYQLKLSASADLTNGLQTIQFDDEVMELLDITCDGLLSYYLNEDKITIGYVPSNSVNAGNEFITLKFGIKECTDETELKVKELQRNNEHISVSNIQRASGHKWGTWKVETEAGELNNGKRVRSCSVCQKTEAEIIPALGHDCPSKNFTDVNQKAWYHSYVDYVVAKGYMQGTNSQKTLFSPNTTTSRAMIVQILYSMSGETVTEAQQKNCKFADVTKNSWYFDAVAWASENGVVAGTSATTFDPNGTITREQIASMLYRYAGNYQKQDVSARADLSAFGDVDKVSGWAKEAISWSHAEGIISGTLNHGVKTLSPQGKASRAEAATMIAIFCER